MLAGVIISFWNKSLYIQVIQRRIDGSVNFDKSWEYYEAGFGNIEHEYWLGWYMYRSIIKLFRYVIFQKFFLYILLYISGQCLTIHEIKFPWNGVPKNHINLQSDSRCICI